MYLKIAQKSIECKLLFKKLEKRLFEKNPAYINTNKSKGEINMNNSNKTNHASKHLGIFASKSVFQKTNVGGGGTPPYVAAIHLIIIGARV